MRALERERVNTIICMQHTSSFEQAPSAVFLLIDFLSTTLPNSTRWKGNIIVTLHFKHVDSIVKSPSYW